MDRVPGKFTNGIVDPDGFATALRSYNRRMLKDAFADIITAGLCDADNPRTMADLAKHVGVDEAQLRAMIAGEAALTTELIADMATFLGMHLTVAARFSEQR